MKILMVHPHDIFSPSEPWTIRIVSLARELRRCGHTVVLAHFPLEIEEKKNIFDLEGIEVVALCRKAGAKIFLQNIKRICKLAASVDIVHFQKCFFYASLPAVIGAWFYRKPLHYDWDDWEEKIWYHSNKPSFHRFLFGNFIALLEKVLPRIADTLSVSSDALADCSATRGVAQDCIFKIPVGADPRKFNISSEMGAAFRKKHGAKKYLILYAGQLHGGQYAEGLIEAAPKIIKEEQDVTFMIVGDGYRRHELQSLVLKRGLADRFVFTGSVPHDEMPFYLAAADVCVACFGDNEITRCKSPLKVVEYMAAGKPIVASAVGEVRCMLKDAGVFVEPDDSGALSAAVLGLLKNKERASLLGLAARKKVEKEFSWQHSAGVLLSAYNKALSVRGLSGMKR